MCCFQRQGAEKISEICWNNLLIPILQELEIWRRIHKRQYPRSSYRRCNMSLSNAHWERTCMQRTSFFWKDARGWWLEHPMVWWVCRFDINQGQWPSPHTHSLHQWTLVGEALIIIPGGTAMALLLSSPIWAPCIPPCLLTSHFSTQSACLGQLAARQRPKPKCRTADLSMWSWCQIQACSGTSLAWQR